MEEGKTYIRSSVGNNVLVFPTSNVKNTVVQVTITKGASSVKNLRALLGRAFVPSLDNFTIEMVKVANQNVYTATTFGCQNGNGVDWMVNVIDGDDESKPLSSQLDYSVTYRSEPAYLTYQSSGTVRSQAMFRIDSTESEGTFHRVAITSSEGSSSFSLSANRGACASGESSSIQSVVDNDGSRVLLLPGGDGPPFWLLISATTKFQDQLLPYEATVTEMDDSQNTIVLGGGWSEEMITTKDVVRYFKVLERDSLGAKQQLKYVNFIADDGGKGRVLMMAERDKYPTSIESSKFSGMHITTCPSATSVDGQWFIGATVNSSSTTYSETFRIRATPAVAYALSAEKKTDAFDTREGHTQAFYFEMPSDQTRTIDVVLSVYSTADTNVGDWLADKPTLTLAQGSDCEIVHRRVVNLQEYDFGNQAYFSKVTIPDTQPSKRWFITVHVPIHYTSFKYSLWPTADAPSNIPDDGSSSQGGQSSNPDSDSNATTVHHASKESIVAVVLILALLFFTGFPIIVEASNFF